jgi:hypothetical protein
MSANARQCALAQRLVLAFLTQDEDAHDMAANEVGDCAGCWRCIAEYLVAELVLVMDNNLTENGAIARTQDELAWLLDLNEADR